MCVAQIPASGWLSIWLARAFTPPQMPKKLKKSEELKSVPDIHLQNGNTPFLLLDLSCPAVCEKGVLCSEITPCGLRHVHLLVQEALLVAK